MANYEAVIKLIVNGEAALTAVKKEIDEIYKTIGKIEKSGILNSKAAETTLALAKQHANEIERAAKATANQIKQNEQKILQQSKLNAAVDLYERRLAQATNSGAAGLKKFQGQIAQIEAAFKFFKDRGNVAVVQALATELGRMVEYSNNVSRNERARAATLSQLRGFAKQLADYELRGLNTAEAREKFDKLKVVADTNQLNQVKKYTEALVRQLQLLKEKASLQAQVAKDTAAVQGALGRLEEEQRQLENSKLDEKALQIQAALDKQAAAAAETAAQTAKLNQRQLEFTERTEAAARAASKQTAEFYRMQRIAKEVAELNRTAGPAQLLLPAAKPGSPLMSGGARSLITGPVERAGGMRTADEAAMALRYVENISIPPRPTFQPPLPPGKKGMFDVPAKGIAGMLGKPGVADAMMGAGFPLLFGAGPGAVLGGGAGGFLGGAMGTAGGPMGMALGIALSAVGQILDQTFVKVADLSRAVNALNMDRLRDSALTVNAALDYQVSLLVQAGKADEARALAARAVFEQTGLTAGAIDRIEGTSNLLKNAWDGVLGAIGGTVGLVAQALLPGLIVTLRLIEGFFRGINAILTVLQDVVAAAAKWGLELIFGKEIAEQIYQFFKGTNEEEEKLTAELARSVDEQKRGVELSKKLLEIDKTRTNDTSTRGKLINIEADKQEKLARILFDYDQKRKEIQEKGRDAKSAEAKKLLAESLALNEAEKNIAIESANLTAERQKQLTLSKKVAEQDASSVIALKAQQRAIATQIENWNTIGSIVSARIGAEQQLNGLQKVRLERDYENAKTAQKRYEISLALFRNEAAGAQLEYQNTLASIALDTEKLKLQQSMAVLKGYEILAEGRLQLLKSDSLEEETKKRQQIEDAVSAQNMVIQGLGVQITAQQAIGKYQAEGAEAAYKTKIETAGLALQQKLASDAIGLSATKAQNIATNMVNAYTNTSTMAGITDNLAVKMNDAAIAVGTGVQNVEQLSTASIGAASSTDTWRQAILDKEEATNKAFQAEYTAIQNNLRDKEAAYAAAVAAAKKGDGEILLSAQTSNAGIALSMSTVFTDIQTLWSQFATFFDTNVVKPTQGAWNTLMQFFRTSTETTIGWIPGYLEFSMKTAYALAYQVFVQPWITLWETVLREPVTAGIAWISNEFSYAMKALGQIGYDLLLKPWVNLWNTVLRAPVIAGITWIQNTWKNLTTFFSSNVITPIRNAWTALTEFLPNTMSNLGQKVKNIWTGVVNTIKTAIRSILQFIANAVNSVGAQVNKLISAFNKLPGPNIPFVPKLSVPAFAEGGVVNRPTLAMVGEGGEREYIIPEKKMAAASASYLAGDRGASVIDGGSASGLGRMSGGSAGASSSPVINIQTGPVLEFNGQQYVTMQDFNTGLQQVADSVYRGLRKSSVRTALRIG